MKPVCFITISLDLLNIPFKQFRMTLTPVKECNFMTAIQGRLGNVTTQKNGTAKYEYFHGVIV